MNASNPNFRSVFFSLNFYLCIYICCLACCPKSCPHEQTDTVPLELLRNRVLLRWEKSSEWFSAFKWCRKGRMRFVILPFYGSFAEEENYSPVVVAISSIKPSLWINSHCWHRVSSDTRAFYWKLQLLCRTDTSCKWLQHKRLEGCHDLMRKSMLMLTIRLSRHQTVCWLDSMCLK